MLAFELSLVSLLGSLCGLCSSLHKIVGLVLVILTLLEDQISQSCLVQV